MAIFHQIGGISSSSIGNVFKNQRVCGIQLCHKILNFLRCPVHTEIPASDQQRSIRILFTQFTDDTSIGIEFHLMIGCVVIIASSFSKSNRMEKVR